MKARVWKSFRFEAAHQLHHVPTGHKCARLHGHSYRIEVECVGEIDRHTGMVRDYAELSEAMKPLILKLDHHNLQDVFAQHAGWAHVETTAENLGRFLLERLPVWAVAVRVFETPTTGTEVRRDVDLDPNAADLERIAAAEFIREMRASGKHSSVTLSAIEGFLESRGPVK